MACIDCKTNDPCPLHSQVCNCIRLNCWHPKGQCDEPPKMKFGTCATCKAWREPEKCPTCGQPLPEEAK